MDGHLQSSPLPSFNPLGRKGRSRPNFLVLACTERNSASTATALSATVSHLCVQFGGGNFCRCARHACRSTSSALCCCSAFAPDHLRCAEQQPAHAMLPAPELHKIRSKTILVAAQRTCISSAAVAVITSAQIHLQPPAFSSCCCCNHYHNHVTCTQHWHSITIAVPPT